MPENYSAHFRGAGVFVGQLKRVSDAGHLKACCDLSATARRTAAHNNTAYALLASPIPRVAIFSANRDAIAAFGALHLHLIN